MQGRVSTRQSHVEECNDDDSISRGDAFRTPCFKEKSSALNAYVVKRSDYSRLPDSSPIPDNFDSVADEDMWLKLNKGLITDLDSLRVTPDKNYQSLMSKDISSVSLFFIIVFEFGIFTRGLFSLYFLFSLGNWGL